MVATDRRPSGFPPPPFPSQADVTGRYQDLPTKPEHRARSLDLFREIKFIDLLENARNPTVSAEQCKRWGLAATFPSHRHIHGEWGMCVCGGG